MKQRLHGRVLPREFAGGSRWRLGALSLGLLGFGCVGAKPAEQPKPPAAPPVQARFFEALAAAKDGDRLPEPEPNVLDLEAIAPELEAKVLADRGTGWKQRPTFEWYNDDTFFEAARDVYTQRFSPYAKVTDHLLHEGVVAVYDAELHRLVLSRRPSRKERSVAEMTRAFLFALAEASVYDARGLGRATGAGAPLDIALRRSETDLAVARLSGDDGFSGYRRDWSGYLGTGAATAPDAHRLSVRFGVESPLKRLLSASRHDQDAELTKWYASPPDTFAEWIAPTPSPRLKLLSMSIKAPGWTVTEMVDPSVTLYFNYLRGKEKTEAGYTSPAVAAAVLSAVRGGFVARDPKGESHIGFLLAAGARGDTIRANLASSGFHDLPTEGGTFTVWSPDGATPLTGLSVSAGGTVTPDTNKVPWIPPEKADATCDKGDFHVMQGVALHVEGVPCLPENHLGAYISKTAFEDAPSRIADETEDIQDWGSEPMGYFRHSIGSIVGFVSALSYKRDRMYLASFPVCGGKKTLRFWIRNSRLSSEYRVTSFPSVQFSSFDDRAACEKEKP